MQAKAKHTVKKCYSTASEVFFLAKTIPLPSRQQSRETTTGNVSLGTSSFGHKIKILSKYLHISSKLLTFAPHNTADCGSSPRGLAIFYYVGLVAQLVRATDS